jgi:hypothetical protein
MPEQHLMIGYYKKGDHIEDSKSGVRVWGWVKIKAKKKELKSWGWGVSQAYDDPDSDLA